MPTIKLYCQLNYFMPVATCFLEDYTLARVHTLDISHTISGLENFIQLTVLKLPALTGLAFSPIIIS